MEVFDQAWLSVCECARVRRPVRCASESCQSEPAGTPVHPPQSRLISLSPRDVFHGGGGGAARQLPEVWSEKERASQTKNFG